MTEETEAAGPTCLYKDGEAKTFEGDDVAQAMTEGWYDYPVPAEIGAPTPAAIVDPVAGAPVESPAAGEPDSMPGASEAAPAPSVG